MSLPATTLRFWWLALASCSVGGCGGKLITLGDGAAGARAVAGAGGVSAGTNGAGSGGAGASVAGSVSAGATSASGGAGSGGTSGIAGSTTGGTGGVAAGPDKGGASGQGAADGCPHGEVLQSELLWIGDSWVQSPDDQRTYIRDRELELGNLSENEDYESRAVAAASMKAVAKQYADREADPIRPKLKVLLMDGATWDPLDAKTRGTSVDDAATTAIADFKQFLADVAADGTVEDIVYFLVPPLNPIPKVEDMRPDLEDACNGSVGVRCHFLYLKDAWMNHPEYTQMALQASPLGAARIGEEIWKIMQTKCIAQ